MLVMVYCNLLIVIIIILLFQPKKKPLPSLEEIKQAIPPQCFEKNWKTSLSYLALDYVIIAGLYLLLPTIEHYGGWMGLLSW